QFYMRFASKQERLSLDDLDDPRIPIGGTPAWKTFNFRSGYNLTKNISIQAAIENILDYNYREHGSGINAPGRNLVFGLRISN
ncbi:MAG: TonB-dependent receptor, partial [Gammaproteobacteria bacterium]|nr:TonB-dependent receptor [Gammaproteobacteria bacterium]